MSTDSTALLRMILYTKAEASLLGFSTAAEHLEDAARGVAEVLATRSSVPDDLRKDLDLLVSSRMLGRLPKDR